jgi:hypothetical protein
MDHVVPPMKLTVIHRAPSGIGDPCPVGGRGAPGTTTTGFVLVTTVDVTDGLCVVAVSYTGKVPPFGGGSSRAWANGTSSWWVPGLDVEGWSKLLGGADGPVTKISSSATSAVFPSTTCLIVMMGYGAVPLPLRVNRGHSVGASEVWGKEGTKVAVRGQARVLWSWSWPTGSC